MKKLFYLMTITLSQNLLAMESFPEKQERQLPASIRYEVMSYLGPIRLDPKEIEKSLIKSYEQYHNARARAPQYLRSYVTHVYKKLLLNNLTQDDFKRLNQYIFKEIQNKQISEDLYSLLDLLKQLNKLNVKATDDGGNTLLMWASIYGHERIVRLLIDAGADFNAKDDSNVSVLMWAKIGGFPKIEKLLIDAGATE
ncbi:ankyrin repeat domain-containing protein [Candidatus Dependentiae bacterium]|nr:ankyrin repeat domain-containing protein [Candidatus Dependentiae bacterium]